MSFISKSKKSGFHLLSTILFTAPIILLLFTSLLYPVSDPNLEKNFKDLRTLQISYPKDTLLQSIEAIAQRDSFVTVHTFRYYQKNSPTNIQELPPELMEIKDILMKLSCIALKGIEGDFNNEELYRLLEEITLIRKKLKNQNTVGSINVQLDNILSALSCGMIFNIASNDNSLSLDKLSEIIQNNANINRYTAGRINDVLKREIGYSKPSGGESLNSFILDMVKDRHKSAIEVYKEKNKKQTFNSNDVILLNLLHRDANSTVSPNPLIDFDELKFASEYFVIRKLELLTQMICDYKILLKEEDDNKERKIKFKDIIQKKLNEESFEVYYTSEIDGNIEDMTQEIENQVVYNLKSKGKRILLTVYRKCTMMISDLNIKGN